jgi:hypothetical protein
MASPEFGFILTRHVTSELVNKYWNHALRCIRQHYPGVPTIIIDDNSNPKFVSVEEDNLEQLVVVRSEFPGRGELLPYIYYLKHRWFARAVILHDSTFIQQRINFDRIISPIMPLWHAPQDRENVSNVARLISTMSPGAAALKCSAPGSIRMIGDTPGTICFGAMAVIKWSFLSYIDGKYSISALVSAIKTRADRCSFERVLGSIFCAECPLLRTRPSLFGAIHGVTHAWTYSWDQYEADLNAKRIHVPMIKIWTGR